MPMFDGVAGTTAVTLTAKRQAAAAPIATWWSRPSAANRAQQESSWRNQAKSCAPAANEPLRGSRNTVRPLRACWSAPRTALMPRAIRPWPFTFTSDGAISTASRTSSGAVETRKSFWVLAWKRSVVETMIPPSRTRAKMLSAVCETSVPIRTGNVSRIRPMWRERTIALAGSPRRAGNVADINTPIIVAEVTSRRRRWYRGSAARVIAIQEAARANIAATIRAQAISTHFTSESMMLLAT